MIEIGRLCVKIAGRDAGKKGIIIDILDDNFVLLDGEVRRRKSNILHIEPLDSVVKIKKNASHEDVAHALKEFGIEARSSKPKQKSARPAKKRKTTDQIREQKQEKKKLRDIFKPKKKEEKTLEAKAAEHKHEAKEGQSEVQHKESKAEKNPVKKEPKKAAPKKAKKE